jgi:predicted metal-binding protein
MIEKVNPQKIAVIRCDIISENCPGVGCLKAFNERRSSFKQYDQDAQIIAFFTCGGCSGRRTYHLIDTLKKYDVDIVHLSSCMLEEKAYSKCHNINDIKKIIQNAGMEIVEGTHH